jgi:DNA modification methylase
LKTLASTKDKEKMNYPCLLIKKIIEISPSKYNPRTISDESMGRLTKSLAEFGNIQPITWNARTGNVVGGHQRLKVYQAMGKTEVEVWAVDLSEQKEKAANIALNKLSGEFDMPMLKDILEEIDTGDLDMEVTGFAMDEIAEMMESLHPIEEDEVPEVSVDAITKLGDLWLLGEHRVLCGDSTKAEDVARLMNGEKADMVFTDPPYGFNYVKKSNGESIENDGDEFAQVIKDAIANVRVDTAYICGDSKTAKKFLGATSELGSPKNCIVWIKPIQHRMHRYEPCHEFIWYWGDNGNPFYGANIFECKREIQKFHPTIKPTELIEYCLKSHTDKKIVIDFFGGSGGTVLACERIKKQARIIEISPNYCDVIVKRWENLTNKKATLAK